MPPYVGEGVEDKCPSQILYLYGIPIRPYHHSFIHPPHPSSHLQPLLETPYSFGPTALLPPIVG